MKKAKMIALIIAAVCVCAMFAACGKTNEPAEVSSEAAQTAAADMTRCATIGEAMALADEENRQSSTSEEAFVFVCTQNGTYWRLTAALTPEQSAALFDPELDEFENEEKWNALISPLAITNCEDLSDMILTDEEMNAIIGKTGEELISEGWTPGYGYNLEDNIFYMDYGPFCYAVQFEKPEQLENTDDFDELEAIRALKVISVEFLSTSDSATDV